MSQHFPNCGRQPTNALEFPLVEIGKPFNVEQEKRKYQKHQGVKSSQVRCRPCFQVLVTLTCAVWKTPSCLLPASQPEQVERQELLFLLKRWFFEEGRLEWHRGFDADGAT